MAAASLWTSAALAAEPNANGPAQARLVSAGEWIARQNCGECHALEAAAASPLPDAPSFPTLRRRFDRDAMARIVRVRMEVIHPRMPKLRLEEDEIVEFLDFWEALKPAQPPRRSRRKGGDAAHRPPG
jgi:mono/diheme cytochrome c family protein